MRPTPIQFYCNSDFFEELLVQAGVEAAHPKVVALYRTMHEWKTIDGWARTFEKDLQNTQQSPYRWKSKSPEEFAREMLRMRKRSGSLGLLARNYRLRANLLLTTVERKIASWPELTYDETKLIKIIERKKNKMYSIKRAFRRRRL